MVFASLCKQRDYALGLETDSLTITDFECRFFHLTKAGERRRGSFEDKLKQNSVFCFLLKYNVLLHIITHLSNVITLQSTPITRFRLHPTFVIYVYNIQVFSECKIFYGMSKICDKFINDWILLEFFF